MSAPKVGDYYGLRVLPSHPYDSDNAGKVTPMGTRAWAEMVRRNLPNGEHYEVVSLALGNGAVSDEQGADVGMDPEAANGPQNGGTR